MTAGAPAGARGAQTDPLNILRAYCIRIVRFVSGGVLDPHLYFERKLLGDIGAAQSADELRTILLGLVEWVIETKVPAERIALADASLVANGYPSLSLLLEPDTRPAGMVLAAGRALTHDDFRLVEALAVRDGVDAADRRRAAELLAFTKNAG